MKTHEPVDGYRLWSNFTPRGAVTTNGRLHTLESLTEFMQKELPHVPIEKMLIQRNPCLGGWSVYLHNDYAYLCEDFERGVQQTLDTMLRLMVRPEWGRRDA